MGLLDKLWDDVLAGPQPEKGLGKLRQKHGDHPQGFESVLTMMEDRRRSGEIHDQQYDARRVSRSIAIKKPPAIQTNFDYSDSPVSSPSASSPMDSPATRDRDNIWRSVFHPGSSKGTRAAKFDVVSPHSPTVYDWVVMSALDK